MSNWPRVRISEVCELIVDCVNKTAPSVPYVTNYKMIRTPNIRNGRVDRNECRYAEKETYEKWTRRANVLEGDVLLTREAPMGQVGYVDFNDTVFLGQRIMQYRANPKLLDSRYLLYAFLSADLQHQFLMHEGSGSVVSHIRVPDCLKFELNLPPVKEQKCIAKILSDLDKKIELNRQINQTLEAMAQAIFQSWFVDFDPVKAKIAAREQWQILTDDQRTEWLNELLDTQDYFKTCLLELTAKAGLNDDENLRLDSSLDLISCRGHGPESSESLDIGLNNLRKEWQSQIAGSALQSASETLYLNITAMTAISSRDETSLADMSADEFSQLYKTASLFPERLVESEIGEIPEGWEASTLGKHFDVVMGQSPKGDTYNEDGDGMVFFQGRRDFGFRYPTPRVYTTDPKRIAQAGDTLISVRAPVGDRNMARQECCLGRGVASIKHKSGARSFTFSFIGHIEKNLSESGSSGTVFSSINKNELSAVKFVAPNLKLLEAFESRAETLDQQVEINSEEIDTLEIMRDSLLPKLLSGEIDITV